MKKIFAIVTVAVLATSLFAEMQYIEIDSIQNATIIKVKSLSDFESLINKNNVAIAYLQTSSKDVLVNIGGTYFSFPLKGYASIKDYKAGEVAGYKDGAEYNEAKSLGIDTTDVYYFYKKNSFQSVADCKDAYKNGFAEVRSSEYYKAKKLGYSNYKDYQEYLEYTGKGFKTKSDWQTATTKGFSTAREFYESQTQGFANYADYKKAHDVGLQTNDELKTYNGIVKIIKEYF